MNVMSVVVIAVCALTAVVVAYMVDSSSAKARKEILSTPPDTPELSDFEAPTYHTWESVRQARIPRELTKEEQAAITARLHGVTPVPIPLGSIDCATDDTGKRAIFESPIVVVCEEVTRFIDLAPLVRRAQDSGQPLVLVTTKISPEAASTIALNQLADRFSCLWAITDDLDLVASITGATVISAADLAAGYLPEDWCGHYELWVADLQQTWILPHESSGEESG